MGSRGQVTSRDPNQGWPGDYHMTPLPPLHCSVRWSEQSPQTCHPPKRFPSLLLLPLPGGSWQSWRSPGPCGCCPCCPCWSARRFSETPLETAASDTGPTPLSAEGEREREREREKEREEESGCDANRCTHISGSVCACVCVCVCVCVCTLAWMRGCLQRARVWVGMSGEGRAKIPGASSKVSLLPFTPLLQLTALSLCSSEPPFTPAQQHRLDERRKGARCPYTCLLDESLVNPVHLCHQVLRDSLSKLCLFSRHRSLHHLHTLAAHGGQRPWRQTLRTRQRERSSATKLFAAKNCKPEGVSPTLTCRETETQT